MATRAKANLPVNYQEQLAKEAAEISKRIATPSGDRIRFNSNRSLITPDGGEGEELEVVVVDFVSSNLFYDGPFDRDNPLPPVCFAIGEDPKTLVPSPNSPEPQASSCAECPMNAFGSAPNGKGKACKNERLMAILPPDAEADDPLWTISAGPTSIKGFDAYVGNVMRMFQTVPAGVVTAISMAPGDYAATLYGDPRPNENVGEHLARLDALPGVHDRALVGARAVVGAGELAHPVGLPRAVVGHHRQVVGADLFDDTGLVGDDDVTGVDGGT